MSEDCLLTLSLTFAKVLAEGRTNHEISIITGFLSNTISNLHLIAKARSFERQADAQDDED